MLTATDLAATLRRCGRNGRCRCRSRRRDVHRLDRARGPDAGRACARCAGAIPAAREPVRHRQPRSRPDRASPTTSAKPSRNETRRCRQRLRRHARDALRAILHDLALRLLTESSLRADLDRLVRLTVRNHCAMPARRASPWSSTVVRPPSPSTTGSPSSSTSSKYEQHEGPCLDALHGQPVRVDVLAADERFTHFARGATDPRRQQRPVDADHPPRRRHRHAQPLRRRRQRVRDDDTDAARIAVAQAAHAIDRSDFAAGAHQLRDRLQATYDEATLTARAEGILIALHDCSSEQARQLLANATAATGSTWSRPPTASSTRLAVRARLRHDEGDEDLGASSGSTSR